MNNHQTYAATACRHLLTGNLNGNFEPSELDYQKARKFITEYAGRDVHRVYVMRDLNIPFGTVVNMEKIYSEYKDGSTIKNKNGQRTKVRDLRFKWRATLENSS